MTEKKILFVRDVDAEVVNEAKRIAKHVGMHLYRYVTEALADKNRKEGKK